MRFIHFGCWNNGKCDLEDPSSSDMTRVMIDLKEYIT